MGEINFERTARAIAPDAIAINGSWVVAENSAHELRIVARHDRHALIVGRLRHGGRGGLRA